MLADTCRSGVQRLPTGSPYFTHEGYITAQTAFSLAHSTDCAFALARNRNAASARTNTPALIKENGSFMVMPP
jgi:hypothetical protein